MSLVQATAPDAEPVSLAEAKKHCNIETAFTDDDTLINALIASARESCESMTRRQLIQAGFVLRLSGFPGCDTIELPRPPLVSIESIQYVDGDGTLQTLSTDVYETDIYTTPGRAILKYGQVWPVTREQRNAVVISYTAGYGEAGSDVPALLRQGMLMRIGHWYENRENVAVVNLLPVPLGAQYCDGLFKVPVPLNIERLGLHE